MSDILQRADKIAGGERSEQYGHPKDNHDRIAAAWSWYLKASGHRCCLAAKDVVIMMMLLKIARECWICEVRRHDPTGRSGRRERSADDRAVKAKAEAAFQRTVIEMAQVYGWKVAHFRPARTKDGGWITPVAADGKGFPDLFCVRRSTRQRFAAELKVPPNTVTTEQDEWLTALEACGIPAYTWTPLDWEEIERVLKDGPE